MWKIAIILLLTFIDANSLTAPSTYPNYLGCFFDPREPYNKFGDTHIDSRRDFSIDECRYECGCNQGKKFAGLVYGGKCYCDDDYEELKDCDCHEDMCSYACRSNSLTGLKDVCGGRNKVQIHNSQSCSNPEPEPEPEEPETEILNDEGNTGSPGGLPPPLCLPLPLDNLCIPSIETQSCYNKLGNLDKEKISNVCEPFIGQDNDQYYKFNVTYTNGWNFDRNCFAQTISIEGQNIPYLYFNSDNRITDGDLVYPIHPNQYSLYYSDTDSIVFTIKHSDLVNLGCSYTESSTSYYWQCEFALDIYFQGTSQLTYNFCIHITMERQTQAVIDAGIFKNLVEGECCVNELNIYSEITFCLDYSCQEQIGDVYPQFVRNQDLYILHQLKTNEFKSYYLQALQVKLGPFIADIIKFNSSIPGQVIIHIKPAIALDNLIIEVISMIQDNEIPGSTSNRRNLQQIRSDYKLNAFNQIDIKEEIENDNINQQKSNKSISQDQNDYNNIETQQVIIIISVTIVCIIIFVTIAICYYFKNKKKQKQLKQQKYQENDSDQNQKTNQSQTQAQLTQKSHSSNSQILKDYKIQNNQELSPKII